MGVPRQWIKFIGIAIFIDVYELASIIKAVGMA